MQKMLICASKDGLFVRERILNNPISMAIEEEINSIQKEIGNVYFAVYELKDGFSATTAREDFGHYLKFCLSESNHHSC